MPHNRGSPEQESRNEIICKLAAEGFPQKAIARQFHICQQRVHQIVARGKKKAAREQKARMPRPLNVKAQK